MEELHIVKGDITDQSTDAIVNAANKSLQGGGGVDGAIHKAAGPQLLEECKEIGGCPTGEARITKGYKLPANHVIHTVGPVWNGGDNGEDDLLTQCYRNSLKLARENQIKTIAFPSISTGAYRFPLERATRIAINTVTEELSQHHLPQEVTFVCFDDKTYSTYQKLLDELA